MRFAIILLLLAIGFFALREPATDTAPDATSEKAMSENATSSTVTEEKATPEKEHTHALPKDRTYGKALIGGEFTLTNHAGETFSNKDLLGKHSLVFLGFTHCPAICPTAMLSVTNAMNQLGEKASEVTPVFISVDPERDTPERLKEYFADYHPSIVGLTGTPEQVKQVAAAYKAYYAPMTADETGNYDMSHSSFLYLMSPEGEYVAHFPHTVGEEILVEEISKRLADNS